MLSEDQISLALDSPYFKEIILLICSYEHTSTSHSILNFRSRIIPKTNLFVNISLWLLYIAYLYFFIAVEKNFRIHECKSDV
jgi:hypothetical protein